MIEGGRRPASWPLAPWAQRRLPRHGVGRTTPVHAPALANEVETTRNPPPGLPNASVPLTPLFRRQAHGGGEALRRAHGADGAARDREDGLALAQGEGAGLQHAPVQAVRTLRHPSRRAGLTLIEEWGLGGSGASGAGSAIGRGRSGREGCRVLATPRCTIFPTKWWRMATTKPPPQRARTLFQRVSPRAFLAKMFIRRGDGVG